MIKFFFTIFLLFIASPILADLGGSLSSFVGYTIISSKTIIGWYDKDDEKKGESFEGCNYGRVIVFDDNTILNCTGYGYQYAYRPTAIILYNGSSFKMVVAEEVYDMLR